MAKLRGTHWNKEKLQKNILDFIDKTFPKQAPHHIIILTNEEYKERERQREERRWK